MVTETFWSIYVYGWKWVFRHIIIESLIGNKSLIRSGPSIGRKCIVGYLWSYSIVVRIFFSFLRQCDIVEQLESLLYTINALYQKNYKLTWVYWPSLFWSEQTKDSTTILSWYPVCGININQTRWVWNFSIVTWINVHSDVHIHIMSDTYKNTSYCAQICCDSLKRITVHSGEHSKLCQYSS